MVPHRSKLAAVIRPEMLAVSPCEALNVDRLPPLPGSWLSAVRLFLLGLTEQPGLQYSSQS